MPAILLDTIFNPWDELQRYQSEHLQSGHFGATATFVGTMRDFNINKSVSHMTLEHYPAMTQHYLDKLCESSRQACLSRRKRELIDLNCALLNGTGGSGISLKTPAHSGCKSILASHFLHI